MSSRKSRRHRPPSDRRSRPRRVDTTTRRQNDARISRNDATRVLARRGRRRVFCGCALVRSATCVGLVGPATAERSGIASALRWGSHGPCCRSNFRRCGRSPDRAAGLAEGLLLSQRPSVGCFGGFTASHRARCGRWRKEFRRRRELPKDLCVERAIVSWRT
jgi:hypothetical protein